MKKKKFSWTFMKYLIVAFIAIISFNIAQDVYNKKMNPIEPIRYAEGYDGIIQESEYIISEAMILSKLQAKSQIVSLEQDLYKKETHVDEGFFGDRHTEIEVKGSYKMGLETKDINVKHIDSASRTVFLELPKPTLISLEVPYDQIAFDKTKGWLRLAMDEDEEKKFYKSVINSIKDELTNDEDVLAQANLHNQEVIKDMITSMTDIRTVVFE